MGVPIQEGLGTGKCFAMQRYKHPKNVCVNNLVHVREWNVTSSTAPSCDKFFASIYSSVLSPVMVEEEDLPPIFREEACKRFAKFHCQDLDMLHISRMIAREGDSLASVGGCLQIDRAVISKIEENESCPKLKDKVHKILLEWQWKNTGNATWARLIKSLQALDDQNLMERIQTYLSQKEYPMTGMLIVQNELSMELY